MARPSRRNYIDANLLRKLWFTDLSNDDLAKKLNITKASLRRRALDIGLPNKRNKSSYKGHPSKIPDDLQKLIIEDYRLCQNGAEVSKKYNIANSSVLEIVKRAGNNTSRVKYNDQEIINAYKKNNSINECCKMFNMGWQTCKTILKRNKISKAEIDWTLYDDKLKRFCASPEAINYNVISKAIGLPVHVTTKRIGLLNIPTPYRKFRTLETFTNDERDEIRRQYLLGIPKKEICATFPVPGTVYERIIADITYNRNSNIPENRRNEFLEYAKLTRRWTKYVINNYLESAPAGMHWDHKLSVVDGFLNDVPMDVIASVENLELLNAPENISKSHKSSITVDELFALRSKRRYAKTRLDINSPVYHTDHPENG